MHSDRDRDRFEQDLKRDEIYKKWTERRKMNNGKSKILLVQ